MEKNKEYTFNYDKEGRLRLDKFLSVEINEASRTYIQKIIDEGLVTINGKQQKGSQKLTRGDIIEVSFPKLKELEAVPQEMNLDIYFEDEDLIVINKPSGIVVHPSPGHPDGTLVNGVLYHAKDLSGINGVLRPGIVHRIDKDTSGLLVVAKNDIAHRELALQFKNKTSVRRYIALVEGIINHEKGTIDAPIGRDPRERKKMGVTNENSKKAVTHFSVLERFENHTLIECKLETGRTHQIRVHLKYIKHPVSSDPLYNGKKPLSDNGQLLHAKILGFDHPTTKEHMEFEAPLPEDFEKIIEDLRNSDI